MGHREDRTNKKETRSRAAYKGMKNIENNVIHKHNT